MMDELSGKCSSGIKRIKNCDRCGRETIQLYSGRNGQSICKDCVGGSSR